MSALSSKEWRDKNRERFRESERTRRAKNKARLNENTKRWRKKNPEKVRAIRRRAEQKRRSTAQGTLDNRISAALGRALKGKKHGRSWENLVGYTLLDLMRHLESKFLPGMSWNNMQEWHVDHIIPKVTFVYATADDKDFKLCWSLSNLQPLWAFDNMSKHSHIGEKYGNAWIDSSST